MGRIRERIMIDYGIQNERNDYRAHVARLARAVYFYATKDGLRVMTSFKLVNGWQMVDGDKTATAEGHLVPAKAIPGCQEIRLNHKWFETFEINEDDTTTKKGQAATEIVAECLRRGLIKVPLIVQEITDHSLQIAGVDLIAVADIKIQVKCDFRGGSKTRGGTGNLFLQVAEINPNRLH